MQFEARHVPLGGIAVVTEVVEATSEAAARSQLEDAGSAVLALRSRAPTHDGAGADIGFDVPWWCREVSTLVRAGMTVVEAIDTLAHSEAGGSNDNANVKLLRALKQGQSLSRAMQSVGGFPPVLVAGVIASERTSTLTEAMADYLQYSDAMDRLRRQVVSAAIYPALVISLGLAISAFLLLYVVPRFGQMYTDLRSEASGLTAVVLWISKTLRDSLALVVTGIGGALVLLVWLYRSGTLWQVGMALIETVPPLRRAADQFRLAKLYQSLALMVRGGYNFDEALRVCVDLGLGRRMADGIGMAREAIARGRAASASMRSGGLTDPVTIRLLAVGERTGSFEAVLKTIAERHSLAFGTFVERATRIAEPVLLMLVAMAVGGIVVMMYVPVFDVASGLHR